MAWSEEIEGYFAKLDLAAPYLRRWALRQKKSGGFPRFLYRYKSVTAREIECGEGPVSEILLDSKLWLSSPDDFNDPFDGRLYIDFSGPSSSLKYAIVAAFMRAGRMSKTAALRKLQREGSLRHLPPRMAGFVDRERARVGICSFSQCPRDILLWSHYGSSHTGIAVQFAPSADPGSLCQVLPVQYSDSYPVLRFGETRNGGTENLGEKMVAALTQKASHWSYEKEWRIALQQEARTHFYFRPSAVVSVLLGAQVSSSVETYIKQLLERRDKKLPKVKMFRAKLGSKKYRLEFNRLAGW